jgi:hypothetical protein
MTMMRTSKRDRIVRRTAGEAEPVIGVGRGEREVLSWEYGRIVPGDSEQVLLGWIS